MHFVPSVHALDSARCASLGAAGLAELLPRIADRRLPVLLDSAGGEPRRWSVLAFDPVRETVWTHPPGSASEVFAALRAEAAELKTSESATEIPGPFAGGWIGALAYDLGVAGEALALPPEPWGQPLVVGGLYTDFFVRDEESGEVWLVLDGSVDPSERREGLLALFDGAPDRVAPSARGASLGALVRHTSAAEHCARIERTREFIAAGEIYQANLAHRFTRAVAGTPSELYARLRERNPAPYMAFLDWSRAEACLGGRAKPGALLSSSPELLVELEPSVERERGFRARTRPIKGTLPRGATPELDRAHARALLASEKDRAELGMIVDLERNDLGRVALPGSVCVDGFPTLESYATVHHLVADVSAEVEPERDAFDVLAALFPGGSITGAPKLRSMEVIAELEGEGRGFFTGSLGFVGLDGRAAFNILIRTLLWRPCAEPGEAAGGSEGRPEGEVGFRVGGGITWSSDAAAEDRETLHKGAALADAIACEGEPSGALTDAPGALP